MFTCCRKSRLPTAAKSYQQSLTYLTLVSHVQLFFNDSSVDGSVTRWGRLRAEGMPFPITDLSERSTVPLIFQRLSEYFLDTHPSIYSHGSPRCHSFPNGQTIHKKSNFVLFYFQQLLFLIVKKALFRHNSRIRMQHTV